MKNERLEKKVREFAQGNAKAFDYIYDNSHKLVFMVAFGILKNRESALDVMQETYRQMIRSINNYNSTNFMAWLTTIARNLSYNWYNKNKRMVFSDFSDQKLDRQCYEERDESNLFALAKELLDEDSYTILVMIVVEGYKRREISKMLSMPVSTVTYKYKIALRTLEEKLTKEGDKYGY
ncbi:MAG: RNA polymerase sigma factor [Christensenellales bacterium]